MLCYKCKKKIDDSSKFCTYCGAQIPGLNNSNSVFQGQFEDVDSDLDYNATVMIPNAPKFDSADREEGITPEPIPAIPYPNNEDVGNGGWIPRYAQEQDASEPPKKRKHIGVILAVIAASIMFFSVVLLLTGKIILKNFNLGNFLFGRKNNSQVFYVKDGKLSAVLKAENIKAGDVEIEKVKNGENYGGRLMMLSEDGNYLYYFSRIDSSGMTGTLCCIPTKKLKKDESKNVKLVEEIDSKVSLVGYSILKDNSVIYIRKGKELIWHKNGKDYELGDCNEWYKLTPDEDYVVYIDEDKLFIVKISQNADRKEIDDDVTELIDVGNKDFILYSKTNKNLHEDLYIAGADGNSELAADDTYSYYGINAETKSFYYTVSENVENTLYDYVDDYYAENDAEIKEPIIKNYLIPISESRAISKGDQEYYSSSKEFYKELLAYSYRYDEEFGAWSYWNEDEYCTYYYNEDEKQWYKYDENTYYTDCEKYDKAYERISLRENLKKETVINYNYKLYYYERGNTTEVCSCIDNIKYTSYQAILYTKSEVMGKPKEKFNIDDIYSVYDLRSKIEYGEEGANKDDSYYFCNAGTGESEVSGIEKISGMYMSEDEKTVLFEGDYEDEGYTILAYPVLSDGLGDRVEVSEAGYCAGQYKNEFYYYEDVDDDYCGKLYVFDGGKSYLLAKDILANKGVFYANDGSILGYSDWDNDGGELSRYNKDGKGEKMVEDISSYTYMGDGCTLFVKDTDLYYLNKKREENRIAKDVDYYITSKKAGGHWISSIY